MLKHLRSLTSRDLLVKRTNVFLKDFSIELLVVAGFFLTSLWLFYFLVHLVILGKGDFIDASAFRLFDHYISPVHTRLAISVTFFGTGSFLIPSYLLIVTFFIRKNCLKYALMVSVMAVSSLLLGWLLKELFHRPRPLHPLISGAGGYSFPSGHALGGFVFSGVILCLVWLTKRNTWIKTVLSIPIVLFGFMIGLSRIYLHVHYATDVMGSLFATFIWFSIFYILYCLIYRSTKLE